MYRIYDYLYNGMIWMKNLTLKRHKELTSLMIYTTTSCQSRCKHCSIWKKPVEHLGLDDIIGVMNSKCITARTTIGLEGGEFVLHPEADKILEWFDTHHPNYTLLTNGLATNKVTALVKKHRPKHLYISLDGDRETYRNMRGRNGYDNVIAVIEACKELVPTSLMFCLSPWNTFKDMAYVIDLAKEYGIDVRIGIYGTMRFFDTTDDLMETQGTSFINQIPHNIRQTDENYDFVALYEEWKNNRLKLRCHSIFSELVIHTNGNVPLCQNLDVLLGNIHETTLDEIFNSRKSCKMQCRYAKTCNQCWINYHRKYDIILLRTLERILPKKLIEVFYGKYQWTDNKHITYKKYFGQLIQ